MDSVPFGRALYGCQCNEIGDATQFIAMVNLAMSGRLGYFGWNEVGRARVITFTDSRDLEFELLTVHCWILRCLIVFVMNGCGKQ